MRAIAVAIVIAFTSLLVASALIELAAAFGLKFPI